MIRHSDNLIWIIPLCCFMVICKNGWIVIFIILSWYISGCDCFKYQNKEKEIRKEYKKFLNENSRVIIPYEKFKEEYLKKEDQ